MLPVSTGARSPFRSAFTTITQRLVELGTKRSGLAVLVVTASVLSSIAIIVAFGFAAFHRWQAWQDWQHPEEASIESLQAGYSIDFFKSKLGTPIITRSIARGFTEDVFKNRGLYVEALTSGGSPEVKYFETVTCDPSVTPHIVLPAVGSVTLNKSTFSSVSQIAKIDYSHGDIGYNGLPYMREYAYGGTQGEYRTFEWGINASCTPSALYTGIPVLEHLPHRAIDLVADRHQLAWVREHAVANEFAMTAPNVSIDSLPPDNLGVDHITVGISDPTPVAPRPGSEIVLCSEHPLFLPPSNYPSCGP